MSHDLSQRVVVLLIKEKPSVHIKTIETIKSADDFAAEFDVGFLVFADGDDEVGIRLAVHDDIRRLQNRVPKEPESVQVLVLNIVERFLIGGNALEPAERRDHGQQQIQLRVLGNLRLHEQRGFVGIESRGQPVDADLDSVLRDDRRVGVIGGEGVPIGNEVKAFVLRIVLQANPILERAEIMSDVQAAGGTHAAQDAFAFVGSMVCWRHSNGLPMPA